MFFLVTFMIWCAIAVIKIFWFATKLMIWLAIAVLVTIARMFPSGRNARYPSMWWVF